MLYDYGIELCGNLREITVQIKRPHADLVATHLVAIVWLNGLIRCGIKEHAGNLVGLVPELRILVLDVGKDLIQIAGVERVDVVLSLRGVRVILGVDDKHLAASGEHDVALHYRQHSPDTIIQSPRDLRSSRCHLRTFLGVVFEDEFLVQTVHALFIHKGGQLVFSGVCSQEHSFKDKLAQADEHTIGIIVPLKPNGRPADRGRIDCVNI